MTQHTPGFTGTPWETSSANSGDDIVWDVCEVDAGDMVADICGTGDEAERRANLIATAPDYDETARKLLNKIALRAKSAGNDWNAWRSFSAVDVGEILSELRAAIAKATGSP